MHKRGGVLVDINPITEYKTGTLEEYLPGVEKYLEVKAMQMGKKPSVTADLQSKKMQVAGEKKKESQRDCKKRETVIQCKNENGVRGIKKSRKQ